MIRSLLLLLKRISTFETNQKISYCGVFPGLEKFLRKTFEVLGLVSIFEQNLDSFKSECEMDLRCN